MVLARFFTNSPISAYPGQPHGEGVVALRSSAGGETTMACSRPSPEVFCIEHTSKGEADVQQTPHDQFYSNAACSHRSWIQSLRRIGAVPGVRWDGLRMCFHWLD